MKKWAIPYSKNLWCSLNIYINFPPQILFDKIHTITSNNLECPSVMMSSRTSGPQSMCDTQMIYLQVETEAMTHLWPALPWSSPASNMFTLFWLGIHFLRSSAAVSLGCFGIFMSERLTLVAVAMMVLIQNRSSLGSGPESWHFIASDDSSSLPLVIHMRIFFPRF